MNPITRKLAKVGYGRLEARYPALRTWKPLVGTVVLAAAVLGHVYNGHDLSATVLEVAAAIGVTEAAPVSYEEVAELVGLLGAAWLALRGVGRKVLGLYRDARQRRMFHRRSHLRPRG